MLAILLSLVLTMMVPDPQDTSTYAFVDVTVIPMDAERTLPSRTVLVQDGRITAVGAVDQVAIPSGAEQIEGEGRYLMPGLAEMHAHIPSPQRDGSMDGAHEVLFLYVANGVTTIRGMLGHPAHLALRRAVEAGSVLGPRIWTSGPSVSRNLQTAAAGDSAARVTKEAGYDFIKIHPGPSREGFDALVRTADALGIPFSGHVPTAVGLMRALEAGYASIDHLDGYMQALVPEGTAPEGASGGWFGANFARVADRSRIPALARATREAGVWNVPTQTLMESYATEESPVSMAERPEMRYVSPRVREQWMNWKARSFETTPSAEVRAAFLEVRRELLAALHDEGAGLLLGSDAPQVWNVPGFSIRRELEALVAAGLTPYEALATGTFNVAQFFEVSDHAGTVAVGKRADLVLLEANPLDDVANVASPAGVMLHGRWVSRDEIERGLREIAAKYAN